MNLLRQPHADDKLRDHVRLLHGVQPYVHNYYTDEMFYREADGGVLLNLYDQRVLRVSEDFIGAVQAGLEEEVGEAAGEVMYRCGYQWGIEDTKRYSRRFQQEFEVEFSKAGMGFMLETWWWPLTIEGWGTWRYDFTQGKQGLIFVDLYESAVARSLGALGQVVCHFYAGLFAATFSNLAQRKLEAIEIQCYAMGEDFCKFLIATDKRVNAAEFWRSEGASAKDILRKLED